jgi:hypothetical protein
MFTKTLILAIAAAVIGAFAVSNSAVAADGETKTLNSNSYQQSASVDCENIIGSLCTVTFPPTTYTTTVVKAVSCQAGATPGSFVGFFLGTSATPNIAFYMAGAVFSAFPGSITATTNASTYLFLNKGDSPHVTAQTSNNGTQIGFLSCTIAGEHS